MSAPRYWLPALTGWIREYSFTPYWLPEILRSQRAGILVAVIGALIPAVVKQSLLALDPSFPYPNLAYVVVIVGLAAAWGLGPALVTLLLGVLINSPIVLRSGLLGLHIGPAFSGAELVGTIMAVATGVLIGVAASLAVKRHLEVVTARAQLAASAAYFQALLEHSSDLVTVLDAEGRCLYASPSTEPILGYPPDALMGRRVIELIHPGDRARLRDCWKHLLQGKDQCGQRVDLRFRHVDGTWRVMESIAKNRLDDRHVGGLIVNSRDISERTQAEEALRRMALHDPLTELPNRTLLLDRLNPALLGAQRDGRSLALLLLDLNHFREVNDTFGHHYGDELLKDVARRLSETVGATGSVARLGGDEFAVLLPDADEAGAVRAIDLIHAVLEHPIVVDGQDIQVRASIGIALGPAHGADGTTLLQRADVALYGAKRAGEPYAVYAAEHDYHSPDRLALMADLRHAGARGELVLYYQPKIEMDSGRLCGVEALVRWQHPSRGLIPPDQFIPLAEQIGVMPSLTQWVLEAAIAQCRAWQRRGLLIPVAVNLAVVNLRDAELPALAARLLLAHDVPPSSLRLEVTESILLADTLRAQQVLTRLAAQGIAISVDDYGTGYSSLAYLQKLPVDELKIDRSFVRHLVENATDAIIVSSTIGLAHSLGLQVVAEGVEDRATWERLAELGCDIAQGYYLSRPAPAEQLEEHCAAARWLPATA